MKLWMLVSEGKLRKVRQRIEEGANINGEQDSTITPLGATAQYGHERIAKLLIEKGAAVDGLIPGGTTPLMQPAKARQEALAEFLLENGADVHAVVYGKTMLEHAKDSNLEEMVEIIQAACNDPTRLPASPDGELSMKRGKNIHSSLLKVVTLRRTDDHHNGLR